MSDPLRVRINRCILSFHLLIHEISLLDFMGILIVMCVFLLKERIMGKYSAVIQWAKEM